MFFKLQFIAYFNSQKFLEFTIGNCFVSDRDFNGDKVIFTRLDFHAVVVKPVQKCVF